MLLIHCIILVIVLLTNHLGIHDYSYQTFTTDYIRLKTDSFLMPSHITYLGIDKLDQPIAKQFIVPKNVETPSHDVINFNSTEFIITKDEIIQRLIDNVNMSIEFRKSVYVYAEGTYIMNDTFYIRNTECSGGYGMFESVRNCTVEVFSGPRFLSVGHYHPMKYGHVVCEIAPSLTLVPYFIVQSSLYFTAKTVCPMFHDILNDIGLKSNQIYLTYDYIFAREYYTMEPYFCNENAVFALQNMRAYFVNLYQLDTDIPMDHILVNREGLRSFQNFDEMKTWARVLYPAIYFQPIPAQMDFVDQVLFYNTVKFVFAMHGSGMANNVFMQPDTVCCEVQGDRIMNNYVISGIATHKYVVEGCIPSIGWRKVTVNIIPRDFFEGMLHKGMSKLE